MKQSVNFSAFVDAFHAHDRYDQFGYQALRVIFDYLEEYEESTGEELELDVISICCDYATQHFADIAEAYGIELDPEDSEEDQKKQVKDFLEVETIVLGETDCEIVYQQF
jgi:hypothetical protein